MAPYRSIAGVAHGEERRGAAQHACGISALGPPATQVYQKS